MPGHAPASRGTMRRMALFSRRPGSAVPASVTRSLADYGRAVIASKRSGGPLDPRFDWDWMSGVVMAMAGERRGQIIAEIAAAARADPDPEMAAVGAYKLLSEYDHNLPEPEYGMLRDAYLDVLRRQGFGSAHLNSYEFERWNQRHPGQPF